MQTLDAHSSIPSLRRVHARGIVVTSQYFFRGWKPRLGPVLTLLIMELRDRCYRDARTGKRRTTCWPSQAELARSLGVSVDTIARALQHDLAKLFVRVEPRYRYDPIRRRKIRTSSMYQVAMEDPPLNGNAAVGSTPQPADQEGPRKMRQEKRNEKIFMNVDKKSARDEEGRVEYLSLHLATQLEDEKNLRCYRRLAVSLPEPLLFEQLSIVKDAHRRGRVKKSRGAMFVDLVKRQARERGLPLPLRSAPGSGGNSCEPDAARAPA